VDLYTAIPNYSVTERRGLKKQTDASSATA